MEDSENCLFHIFLAPSKHIKSRVHVSIKEITLGWEVWKKCSVILLWAALPSLHTRPSSFFGLAVAEGAAAAAVSPVGQPRKAKKASSSNSQGRQRGPPAATWATCPDRQFSHMIPGTGAVGLAPVLCHPSCHCWGRLGSCPHQQRVLLCQNQAFPTATTTKLHPA